MCSLYKHLRENRRYFVNYNIELFAGMYIHPKDRLYPTMLIFRTGSYILMGGKSLKILYKCEQFLQHLIEKFNRM